MGQRDSVRDFGPAESSENAGILCVFPVFRTVRMGQKTRRSPRLPPKRCCLKDTSSVKRPASGAILGGSHASLPDEISPPGRLGSNFALAFLIGLCYSIEEIIPAGVLELVDVVDSKKPLRHLSPVLGKVLENQAFFGFCFSFVFNIPPAYPSKFRGMLVRV